MSFFAALLARPTPASRLSRYIVANGLFYLPTGALFLVWPDAFGLVGVPPFVGAEAALVRVIGMVTMIIGWFYIFGGRTNTDSFALCTVVDRLFVPVVLVPLWATGQLPAGIALPFAVLDPVLGLGALAIWATDRRH